MRLFHYHSLRWLGILIIAMAVGGACGSGEDPTAVPRPTAPAATAKPAATPMAIPTPTPSGVQVKSGGILRVVLPMDPPTWDPMFGISWTAGVANAINADGNLIRPCRWQMYELCPGAAESWESNADFTEWTFKIRDNIFWHDGEKFTAEDAKFFMDLAVKGVEGRTPASGSSQYAFDTAEVLSGNKLKITLKEPRPWYLLLLGRGTLQIAHPPHLMNPEIAGGNPKVAPQHVNWVSVGPYKYKNYQRGSVFELVKHDQYWEKDEQGRQLPFLDGITYPIIVEGSTGVAAFRAGRVDVTGRQSTHHLTPEQKFILERAMGDKAKFIDTMYLGWDIFFNNLNEPMTDVRVRKAMSLWIDKDAGVMSAYGGSAEVYAMWSPNSVYVNPDVRTWPGLNPATKEADRAEAKRLMAEAGFPDGFKVKAQVHHKWIRQNEWMIDQLAGLGIETDINVTDGPTHGANVRAGNFDIMVASAGSAEVPDYMCNSFCTFNKGNGTHHNDTHVDDLFTKLGQAQALKDRISIAQELERYIYNEQYISSSAFFTIAILGLRDYVHNLTVGAENTFNMADNAEAFMSK